MESDRIIELSGKREHAKGRCMRFIKTSIHAALFLLPIFAYASWQYNEKTDQMRGTKSKTASLLSTNQANFNFPYNGGSELLLTVRKRPSDGLSVLLVISKGQFNCLSGCTIHAKFDNGKVESYSADGPSDGSSDVIFVEGAGRFVSKLKKAKRLIIEAEFYSSGRKQFQFEADGLSWD